MKIGIYVGSFNPPHLGHIKIANHLVDNYLDKVIIVPTGNYWDKQDLIDIYHRINMLKFFENKNIMIDNKNNDVSYTYQLLDNLSHEYKEDELYLILGADNLINLDKWKNYDKILRYNLIVLNRSNIDALKYLNQLNKITNYIVVDDLSNIDISSTLIRNKLKEKDYNNILKLIDERVYKYIEKNNLYGGSL